ncbi:MAG: transketolase [Lachnospiraceae bacterium]|nr:transketolase [Lachnospiraceae bacterium]
MNYDEKGNSLRKDIIKMLYEAKSGHPGGSLSCVEILMALYYDVMNVDAKNPKKEDRDRFVMSKGHGCPALYAILADKGFFDREDLWTLRKIDSTLQGHPDNKKTKGIDVNTGSLGQGASVAVGMAMAAKKKNASYKVYTLLGDGECQEGIVWEAAMAAAHYKLDNLVFILDYNGLQIDGSNDEVMALGDIVAKFKAFGWETVVCDGHNVSELVSSYKKQVKDKPLFVCAKTIKGKGVSFMEDQFGWHGKVMSEEDYNNAMKALEV